MIAKGHGGEAHLLLASGDGVTAAAGSRALGVAASDAQWVVPAAIFVAAQYAIAVVASLALGFPHLPPLVGYLVIGGVATVGGAVVLLLRTMWTLYRSGDAEPARALRRLGREHRSRLLVAAIGIQLVVLQVGSLTWLKSLMPLIVPFWADPMLADLDYWLFLGHDPWRLLLPLKPIEPLIDTIYALWFPIKAYTMAIILISLPSFRKSRAILAYFYTIGIFGVLGQYLLSSAGPLFYEMAGFGTRFTEMEPHLSPMVKAARAYLWNSYITGGDAIGGGISAMPSIHVAIAAWVALAVRSLFRPLAIIGWAFFAVIMVGSVYLGWHYAVDGIAGALAALVAWKLADMTLRRGEHVSEGGQAATAVSSGPAMPASEGAQ